MIAISYVFSLPPLICAAKEMRPWIAISIPIAAKIQLGERFDHRVIDGVRVEFPDA